MKLGELSRPIDYAGASRAVIEDEPLLEWARENGLSPREAQVAAIEEEIIPLRYLKNFTALSFAGQLRLCRSKVFICGCGGLGGTLVDLLSRAGVGYLRLVDRDVFTPSNLNRQCLVDTRQMSKSKASVAFERVIAVNPFVEVDARPVHLDSGNAEALAAGVDLVLDAMDNIGGRFALAEAAARLRIPFIHAAAAGWWGQVSTFQPAPFPDSPDSDSNSGSGSGGAGLSRIYGSRRMTDMSEEAVGVLGPAVAVIGSLQACEALRILSGGRPSYENRLLYFDGETGRTELLPL